MDLLDGLFVFAALYVIATGAIYLIRKEVIIKERNPRQTIRYSGKAAFYLGSAHLLGGIFLAASLLPQFIWMMFVGIVIVIGGYWFVSRRYEKEIIEKAEES